MNVQNSIFFLHKTERKKHNRLALGAPRTVAALQTISTGAISDWPVGDIPLDHSTYLLTYAGRRVKE